MGGDNDLPSGRGPVTSAKASQVPWEPSVRDLEIYAGLAEGRSTRHLAEKFSLSHQQIHRIGRKIDDWLRPQWMEHIRDVKTRQAEGLMVIYREQMAAWRKSKKEASKTVKTGGGTGPATSTTTKTGNTAHHQVAMAALADIRKIWGADAAVDPGDTESDWISGRPREDVIREHIARMQAAIEPREN